MVSSQETNARHQSRARKFNYRNIHILFFGGGGLSCDVSTQDFNSPCQSCGGSGNIKAMEMIDCMTLGKKRLPPFLKKKKKKKKSLKEAVISPFNVFRSDSRAANERRVHQLGIYCTLDLNY